MGNSNNNRNQQQSGKPTQAPAAAPENNTAKTPDEVLNPATSGADGGAPPEGTPRPEGAAADAIDGGDDAADTPAPEVTAGATGTQVSSASDKVGVPVAAGVVKAVNDEHKAAAKTDHGIYTGKLGDLMDQLSGNKIAVAAFTELQTYLVEMKPGKQMDWEQGAKYQVSLYRTLQLIFNQTVDDFPRVFGTLLAVYNEFGIGKGALGPQHLFRFTGMINMTAEDIKGFHSLNHLLVMLADPDERAANIKHIDFNVQLAHGLTEDGRRRILAYFKR